MGNQPCFSVSQLSQLAQVSVRTLHHYDKLGLLTPLRNSENGYREYHREHLAILQQIMVYRALGFSLEQIKTLIHADDFDILANLQKQKQLLLQQQKNTQAMIHSLEATMDILNGKKNLEIMFDGFPPEKTDRWQTMVKESQSPQEYEFSMQALSHFSEGDILQDKSHFLEWIERYRGVLSCSPSDQKVQVLIKEHYDWLTHFFGKVRGEVNYPGLAYTAYRQFSENVNNDAASKEMYDYYQTGLAQHFYLGMVHFAEHTLKTKAYTQSDTPPNT